MYLSYIVGNVEINIMNADLETGDYIYIEAINIILYYFQLPEEKRGYYSTLYKEACNIAESRNSIHKNLMKELIAQDAIAFRIKEQQVIKPNAGLYSILNILSRYVGNIAIDIIINRNNTVFIIATTTVDQLLLSI